MWFDDWYSTWFGDWFGQSDEDIQIDDLDMLKGPISILESDVTVQSLVGEKEASGATGYKVYPVIAPESEKAPYIVLRQTGGIEISHDCARQVEFVVACYHNSYDDVQELDNACYAALKGTVSGTYNGVEMSMISPVTLAVDGYVKEHHIFSKLSSFNTITS